MADLGVTPEQAVAWLALYQQAWVTQDTALIVSLFTPDGLYHETRFRPPFAGHAGIRAYWDTDVVARQRDIEFSFSLWAVDGPMAYAHWHAAFTDLKKGVHREVDGVFRLTFAAPGGPAGLLCGVLEEWWNITPAP